MPYVVTQAFGDFAVGARLTDADAKGPLEAGQGSLMVRVAAPAPPPAATPAPAAAASPALAASAPPQG